MFIAVLILGVILLVAGIIVYNSDYDGSSAAMLVFGGIFIIVGFIGGIWNGGCLVETIYVIDQKITMYEEENSKIESRISETVQRYMEYEKDIVYKVSENDDVFTLITLYPDLKSDTLVEAEINTYIENNNKIKELRNQQLNKPLYKFMIYFGH